MKLRITTLVIVEEGQDIYHSFEDDQDKAYQEIINQVILFSTGYQRILRNRTYRDPRTNSNRI